MNISQLMYLQYFEIKFSSCTPTGTTAGSETAATEIPETNNTK